MLRMKATVLLLRVVAHRLSVQQICNPWVSPSRLTRSNPSCPKAVLIGATCNARISEGYSDGSSAHNTCLLHLLHTWPTSAPMNTFLLHLSHALNLWPRARILQNMHARIPTLWWPIIPGYWILPPVSHLLSGLAPTLGMPSLVHPQ